MKLTVPATGINVSSSCPFALKTAFETFSLSNDVIINDCLQRETNGGVFLASLRGHPSLKFIVKISHKGDLLHGFAQQSRREAIQMAFAGHSMVVQLYAWWEDTANITLIQEYLEGGDLVKEVYGRTSQPAASRFAPGPGSLAEGVGEARAAAVLRDALEGLGAMHDAGILHRDIKLENIMRTGDGRCKLGDLGFAISVAERPRSRLGTLIMMSPEILAAKPKRVNMDNLRDSLVGGAAGGGAYGTEVDVWSLGVVAYELLFARAPFRGSTVEELQKEVDKPLQLPACSANAADFVKRALERDGARRATARDLLAHPFIAPPEPPQPKATRRNPAASSSAAGGAARPSEFLGGGQGVSGRGAKEGAPPRTSGAGLIPLVLAGREGGGVVGRKSLASKGGNSPQGADHSPSPPPGAPMLPSLAPHSRLQHTSRASEAPQAADNNARQNPRQLPSSGSARHTMNPTSITSMPVAAASGGHPVPLPLPQGSNSGFAAPATASQHVSQSGHAYTGRGSGAGAGAGSSSINGSHLASGRGAKKDRAPDRAPESQAAVTAHSQVRFHASPYDMNSNSGGAGVSEEERRVGPAAVASHQLHGPGSGLSGKAPLGRGSSARRLLTAVKGLFTRSKRAIQMQASLDSVPDHPPASHSPPIPHAGSDPLTLPSISRPSMSSNLGRKTNPGAALPSAHHAPAASRDPPRLSEPNSSVGGVRFSTDATPGRRDREGGSSLTRPAAGSGPGLNASGGGGGGGGSASDAGMGPGLRGLTEPEGRAGRAGGPRNPLVAGKSAGSGLTKRAQV